MLGSDLAFVATAVVLQVLTLVLAWRIVGGRATLPDYLPIQLYYSAVFGLIVFFGNRVWQGVLKFVDPKLHDLLRQVSRSGEIILHQGDSPAPILSMLPVVLTLSLLLAWFVAGWGAYRRLNGVSRARSAVAAAVYLGLALPAFGILGLVAAALLGDLTAPAPG